MVDAAACGRHTAVDAALCDRLACDAGVCVDILIADGHCVRVCHPAHLPFTGAHIRGRDVNARPYNPNSIQFSFDWL